MTTDLYIEKFESIKQKMHLLVEERNLLLQLVGQKESEIGQFKTRLDQLEAELTDFKNHDKISKIVSEITDKNRDQEEIKNKLTEYIRVIDRCIKLLNE